MSFFNVIKTSSFDTALSSIGSSMDADIALYPWSVILEDMAEINLDDYPNMKNWATAIGNRSAAQPIARSDS